MGRSINPDIVYRTVNVSAPDMSKDGKFLTFTKSWVDEQELEDRSQIEVANLEDGSIVRFTYGQKDSHPSFSHDDKYLGFLRADSHGKNQVWIIPTLGGEASQVTKLVGGVSDVAWSPTDYRIVIVSNVDPDELPTDHDPKKNPRVKVVTRIKYRHDVLGWRGDGHRQLFVADAMTGDCTQITSGDFEHYAPVWSPDASKIAFISERSDDRDLFDYSQAYVVSSTGGDPEMRSSGLHTIATIAWSPNGDGLIVVGSDIENGSASYQGWIYIVNPGKGLKQITDDSIKPVAGFPPQGPFTKIHWTASGTIYFLADSQGETFICSISESGEAVNKIYGGNVQLTAMCMSPDASLAAVVSVSTNAPSNIEVVKIPSGEAKKITNYNDDYLSEHSLGKLDKFELERAGFQIQSRVMLPPDFDESKKYPMILEIHGGPNGVFTDAFNPLHQILANAGYIVLAVNPRGSSTYGSDFTMAVLNDWGGEDYLDLMQAVDEMIGKPYVDQSRLGVHGYSYGGYMTSWIVGHTHRFKAAIVGAPCIDLSSMSGTSDIGISFGEKQWGGRRDVVFDELMKRSPITYAPNVETPVLLLHGESDLRCPIGQSEQYFVSLKRLGKEVEFVRFPGGAHGFRNSGHLKMREEYLNRVLGWYEKHIPQ